MASGTGEAEVSSAAKAWLSASTKACNGKFNGCSGSGCYGEGVVGSYLELRW